MAEHKFTEGDPVYICRECGEHFDKHEEFRREGKADSAKPHVFQRQWQLDAMCRIAEQHPASYAARDVLVLLSDLEAMRTDNVKLRDYYDATHSAAGFGYPESSLRGIESNRDEVIATLAELDRMRKALEEISKSSYGEQEIKRLRSELANQAHEVVTLRSALKEIASGILTEAGVERTAKSALNPQPTEATDA